MIKRHQDQLHMRQSSLPQVFHPGETPVTLDIISSSSVRLPEPLQFQQCDTAGAPSITCII